MYYHKSNIIDFAAILCFLLLFAGSSPAQPQLAFPRLSPHAKISQTIGLAEITVDYHRPGVKGRTIWGDLVPYDEVWRAGANENTTISFTDPVKIEGKDLPAGSYGLHMIPTSNNWTVIFSNISWAWGSFTYDEKEDALRVDVQPEAAQFEERLSYRFDNPTNNSVVIALYWDKLRVPVKIEMDEHAIVLASIRKELRSLPRFYWQGWNQAANYCYRNNINHQEALEWVDNSIRMNENFSNLQVKAGLMEQLGKTSESQQIMKTALDLATERDLNIYGYQLLDAGKTDEAIEIFKKNVKDYPDSWNVYDSLGEALAKKGDKAAAIKNYTKALSMVKSENEKTRINKVLVDLQSK